MPNKYVQLFFQQMMKIVYKRRAEIREFKNKSLRDFFLRNRMESSKIVFSSHK